jgi:hypothetical protein
VDQQRGRKPGAGPHLVVLAAGIGSRYGGLKQTDPIGPAGEIVVDYGVFDALRAGFTKVVFVLRRELLEDFRDRVGRRIEPRIATDYVFQELDDLPSGFACPPGRAKPWGTAQAVLSARGAVSAPFAAINADDFYGPGAFRVLHDFLQQVPDGDEVGNYAMVGYPLVNTLSEHGHVSRGVCNVNAAGYLDGIVERTRVQRFTDGIKYAARDETWIELPPSTIVSMNMWGFPLGFLDRLAESFQSFLTVSGGDPQAECYLPTVVSGLIQTGQARVKVLPTDERWFGITYQADKAAAQRAVRERIRAGQYPERLWS